MATKKKQEEPTPEAPPAFVAPAGTHLNAENELERDDTPTPDE
jgi:hypothetical protein